VSAELVTSAVFPGRVEPGVQLGSYEVLLCVARGGMASVWAARERMARGQSRVVALKTVLPELSEPEFESMFREEARVAARIHHPNVCEVFQLLEQDGVLALAMEWVDGDTLNGLLGNREQMTLDPRVAAFIVAQAAGGLHAAHELTDEKGAPMQLVHRDVSPQNILISRAGRVKVADFGVAKGLGGSREQTEAGRIKGKLSYMSPEQAEGKPLDRRSDVYALGVVLYVATVGVHPFRGVADNRDDQLLRLLVGQFEPPSALVASYPKELEAIVLRAMQREPEDRFATAEEMRLRLQDWLGRSDVRVGESSVANVLTQRLGKALDQRGERLQRCLLATHQLRGLAAAPSVVPDVAFMPTTRGVSHTLSSLRAVVPVRPATRGILTALAAAAIGVVGTLAFTGNEPDQSQAPAPPAAVKAAAQAPAVAAPRAEPRPEPAHPPRAESGRSTAAGNDSELSGMAAARRRAHAGPHDTSKNAGHQRLDSNTQRSVGSALSGTPQPPPQPPQQRRSPPGATLPPIITTR